MKTTENISLAGYAFTIETDAYDVLVTYLNEIRKGFEGDSCADEIIADIEERIAELLSEQCRPGMVVNLRMVSEIKERIGKPSDMAQEEVSSEKTAGSEEKSQQKEGLLSRKLYRNIEERVFGGVCAGLGTYFKLDKVLFRIIFLTFFFIGFLGIEDGPFFGFSMLIYICLWIAMPAARTGDQKREMRGRPTKLESYKSKDFDFNKEINEVSQSPAGQTVKRAGGIFLGLILLIIGCGGLLGSILIPSVPSIIEKTFLIEFGTNGIENFDMDQQMVYTMLGNSTFWTLVLVFLAILSIWFLYNGVMLTFNLKSPSWKPGLVLFIAWVISIFAISAWTVRFVAEYLPQIIV